MTAATTTAPTEIGVPSDPREFRYLPVGDLVVDDRKQRKIDAGKVAKIAAKFDWAKFEVLTVVAGADGLFDVVEGQHRSGAALAYGGTELLVPCMILPATSDADQAELALDITKGRTAHTTVDKWKLTVLAGSEREVLATAELDRRGLRVARGGSGSSPLIVSAAATLNPIIRHGEPADGAELLGKVLDVLLEAFPPPAWEGRWTSSLLGAVAGIFARNGDLVDYYRLIRVLQTRPAVQWVAIGKAPDRVAPPAATVAAKVLAEYNKGLRTRRLA